MMLDPIGPYVITKASEALLVKRQEMRESELKYFISLFSKRPEKYLEYMIEAGIVKKQGGTLRYNESNIMPSIQHREELQKLPRMIEKSEWSLRILALMKLLPKSCPTKYAEILGEYRGQDLTKMRKILSKCLRRLHSHGLVKYAISFDDSRRRLYELSDFGDDFLAYAFKAKMTYHTAKELMSLNVVRPRDVEWLIRSSMSESSGSPQKCSLIVHPWTSKKVLANVMKMSNPDVFDVKVEVKTADIMQRGRKIDEAAMLIPIGDDGGYYYIPFLKEEGWKFVCSVIMPSIAIVGPKGVERLRTLKCLEGTVAEQKLVGRAVKVLKASKVQEEDHEEMMRGYVEEAIQGKCADGIVVKSPYDFILQHIIPEGIRVMMKSGPVEMGFYVYEGSNVDIGAIIRATLESCEKLKDPLIAVEAAWEYISEMPKILPYVPDAIKKLGVEHGVEGL